MKTLYLFVLGAGLILASCSTSRNVRYGDDVYNTGEAPAGSGDYVTVYNTDDQDAYNYREDYEIRRGINNPLYRTSVNIGLGLGSPYMFSPFYGGFGYNPFYSPFYDPFMFGGYSAFSFSYNPFFSPFYGGFYPYSYYAYSPFYNPYYGMGHYYPTYYGYGGGYPYMMNNIYSTSVINNNYGTSGSRMAGIRSAGTNSVSGNAPVRTLRGSDNGINRRNGSNSQGVMRRVFGNSNRNSTDDISVSRRGLRSGREYVPSGSLNSRSSSRSARTFSPSNENSRMSVTPRRDNFNSAPSRSFQRSEPSFQRSEPSFRSSAPTMRSSSPAPSRGGGARRF